MLIPRIVDVSEKGQILIPVALRRHFGVKPKGKVYLLPDEKEKAIKIKPIKKNIVDELCGILADVDKGHSWTQELAEERRRDLIREETKFDSLFKKQKTMRRKSEKTNN